MTKNLFLPEVGLVREPVVLAHVQIGRTKWLEMVRSGRAPTPQKLGPRLKVYDAAQIRRWIASPELWSATQDVHVAA